LEQLPTAKRLRHSIFEFVLRFVRAMREEDLGAIAAQMTYYFMLGLFPTLILMVWVLDALPLSGDMAAEVGRAFSKVSGELGALVQSYLEEFTARKPSGSVLLWAFAALWAASRGIGGARKGLNRVFRSGRRRNFAKLRMLDLGLTLLAILFVGLANFVLLGGEQLAHAVMTAFGLHENFAITWAFVRWPLVLALLLAGVVLAYRFLPSRRLAYRFLFYGAVPTVLGWLLLGLGFRLWLKSVAGFDRIYGSLASFFLLMFFLWMVSLCLLIGGQTAALMADEELGRKPAE
jgi:membrane protein